MDEGIGKDMIGEWELLYLNDCEPTNFWIECWDQTYLDSNYELEFKKNARMISRENNKSIWCGKLSGIELLSSSSYGDRIELRLKKDYARGSTYFGYLRNDTLRISGFPNPALSREDNDQIGGRTAVYVRK